jgi:hypothetical protein
MIVDLGGRSGDLRRLSLSSKIQNCQFDLSSRLIREHES